MTIYLEIVRKFLIDSVTDIRDTAIAADRGVLNYLASLVYLERNPVVSKGKQNLCDELLNKLKDFKDASNDRETLQMLKTLLEKYKAAAALKSGRAGYDEGAFGPGMLKAKWLIKALYEHLDSVGMLNIPYDNDSLNIYRFHMAQYFSKKLLKAAHEPTFIERLLANPKIALPFCVTDEKKKLILDNLTACENKLMKEYAEVGDYPAGRRDWVLVFIEKLSRKNKGVCEDHSISPKASLTVYFFTKVSIGAGSIGPGIGLLHECLVAAFQQVRSTPLRKKMAVAKDPEPVQIEGTEEDFTEVDLSEKKSPSMP